MRFLDYPDNPRLPLLLEMVTNLSKAVEPLEVLQAFGQGWSKLEGSTLYISLSCRGLEPGQYRITRRLIMGNPDKTPLDDVWQIAHTLPVHTEGLLGRIVSHGKPVIVQDFDLRDDPVLGDSIASYRSLVAIPLYDGGKVLNWAISLSEDPDIHTEKELEDGLLRGNLVGGTVRHVQTAKKLREVHQRIKDEVSKIANIQRALLPERLPQIPGLSLAARYQTYDQAGGDFYTFHPLGTAMSRTMQQPDGRWAFVIGDVSGHGPAAAVVMAMVESILSSYPMTPNTTGQVLEYLNKHLCNKRIYDTFVTAFHALYDPATRQLTYSRAGHPPPLWRKPSNNGHIDMEELDAVGGLPLGIMHEETYEDATVTLEPGHTLTLYTDGIPETRSPNGAFFGTPGIIKALRACSGEADCAVDTIMQHARTHEAGGRPQDDQTLVVLKVLS
ncbi:MAG: GAF domain-containing SpoIIE family protein phosphatase [Phycisphaerales bacterium]